jgi:hypothetical protein
LETSLRASTEKIDGPREQGRRRQSDARIKKDHRGR